MPYKIIFIRTLKPHENIRNGKLESLIKSLEKKPFVVPIIVDKKHRIILDGHHRYNALKKMGYTKIPAHIVDYEKVNLRPHGKMKVSKDIVIERALSGELLPPKTTKHIYKKKWKKIRVPLEKLS